MSQPFFPGDSDDDEDDEVASEVAVAIPMISVSAPGATPPAVSEDRSGPSVPSSRKPGDLLKEQLKSGASNGMTFADRVRIEGQKEGLVTNKSRADWKFPWPKLT